MLEGLFSAAAGLSAQQEQLDSISNDLANLNTTGYKSERVAFNDLLYSTVKIAGTETTAGAGANAEILGRSQSQGAVRETGNPLDVAIDGHGYLQVTLPERSAGADPRRLARRSTRPARSSTGAGNRLFPPITVPTGVSPSQIAIAPDGTVTAGEKKLGKLALVTVTAPDRLTSLGGNLLATSSESGAARAGRRAHPPGHARAVERRHGHRDGGHGHDPASFPDGQHRDPDREPDDDDRERAQTVSAQLPHVAGTPASGLPPVDSAREPAWVRNGSASTRQAYQAALAFEEVLVEQMTSALGEAGTLDGEGSGTAEGSGAGEGSQPQLGGGMLSSMLPQALSRGVIAGGGLGLAAQLTHEMQGLQATATRTSGVSGGTGAAGAAGASEGTSASANGATGSSGTTGANVVIGPSGGTGAGGTGA